MQTAYLGNRETVAEALEDPPENDKLEAAGVYPCFLTVTLMVSVLKLFGLAQRFSMVAASFAAPFLQGFTANCSAR